MAKIPGNYIITSQNPYAHLSLSLHISISIWYDRNLIYMQTK